MDVPFRREIITASFAFEYGQLPCRRPNRPSRDFSVKCPQTNSPALWSLLIAPEFAFALTGNN